MDIGEMYFAPLYKPISVFCKLSLSAYLLIALKEARIFSDRRNHIFTFGVSVLRRLWAKDVSMPLHDNEAKGIL